MNNNFSRHSGNSIVRYLMVEDSARDAELFATYLHNANRGACRIDTVRSLGEALLNLQREQFDAMILDLGLPDNEGVSQVSQLALQFPELPIVVLTGADNLDWATATLRDGAQDYLCKNDVTAAGLMRALRYAVIRKQSELQLKSRLRDTFSRNSELESAIKYDALTGLPNRSFFIDLLGLAIGRADRKPHQLAVLYFDLNGFKSVNDQHGHAVGDQLLQQLGQRVASSLRKSDTLARLSGDEFVVLVDYLKDGMEAYAIAQKIVAAIEPPFRLDSHTISITASIGIAGYPDCHSVDSLIAGADAAMYEAKQMGGSAIVFYTDSLEQRNRRRQEIQDELVPGLTQGELTVDFQPIVNASDRCWCEVEAYSRWYSPRFGSISPYEFIPVIEACGAGALLVDQLLTQCASLLQACLRKGIQLARIGINLSAPQLISATFVSDLMAQLNKHAIAPNQITLEIAEPTLLIHLARSHSALSQLREQGFNVTLDGYGSGSLALLQLRQLPIDRIKFDRTLVTHIDRNPQNQALLAGVCLMAERLNIETCAVGIERDEEIAVLHQLGCRRLQGFYFGEPMMADDLLNEWPSVSALNKGA